MINFLQKCRVSDNRFYYDMYSECVHAYYVNIYGWKVFVFAVCRASDDRFYGVASVSRIHKMIGLFCKRAL